MVAKSKVRKSGGLRKRLIGKPAGRIQERVQAAGPERFGVVAVDCAKRRSNWMLCDFYGKVLVEPTSVEETAGGLSAMTRRVAEACRTERLTDSIVAAEMTGIYHKPAFRAFRQAGFDTRIVHPLPQIISVARCIPAIRPTTTIWRPFFTRQSKATA